MNRKGFIQIPILIAIITGFAVVGGISYFSIGKFQAYQYERQEKDKQVQQLLISQQKTLENTNRELEEIKKNNQEATNKTKTDTAKKLSNTQEAIKEVSPQQKKTTDQSNIKYKYVIQDTVLLGPGDALIKTLTKGTKVVYISKYIGLTNGWSNVEVDGQVGYMSDDYLADSMTPNVDVSVMVQKWRPFVVYISCDFKYSNGTTYLSKSGSGTDYNGTVITNKHVITDDNGYGASSCSLKFPGSSHIFIEQNSAIRIATNDDDWGTIVVSDRNSYINSKSFDGLYGCQWTPSVGDEVIILGYPDIGSRTDITVTRGIISGKDGNYYITDAKIDHGNSGGTAVFTKGDCYLGIPTFVIKGTIESLGRILDIETVSIVGRG